MKTLGNLAAPCKTATLLFFMTLATSPVLRAQARQSGSAPDAMHQLSNSVQTLVRRVSPCVVQIVATGYSSFEQSERGETNLVIGQQRAIGSGVIVDPDGYIITNAHVLNGAEKIEVIVPPQGAAAATSDNVSETIAKRYPARKIGTAQEMDLAVIKIEAHGLHALHIRNTLAKQGELVLAFGSPQGLSNTVTMGVVSSVARQIDPDSPFAYIQTDAPINPGNSGGPLVNTDGDLLGINTLILSTSGGSQGLGFAIPAGIVSFAYPQLREFGHVHRPEIGAIVQTITPELAAGLRLQRDFGIIVSDIVPNGPADEAGLRTGDVIFGVDGTPTVNLPLFMHNLYMHKPGESARVEVLRGSDRLQLDIPLIEPTHKEDTLSDIADPEKNLIRRLGILGIELNPKLAESLSALRIPTGVIVAALTTGDSSRDIPLQTGEIIHALNGTPITTLASLRQALAGVKRGDPVALQLERGGQLIYASFVMD